MSPLSTVLDMPAAKVADPATSEIIALYEKYKRPLHTYIYRLLGSLEDADDVIQEVFLTAFVSWHDLNNHSRLSSWLYRVATNLCLDQLRRRKRISWWPLTQHYSTNQQSERGADEEASYLPTNSGGIPEICERELIHLALSKMPEDYAAVLIMSADQGISYLDIATIMGISARAAATRISRAKRMFAEQYRRLSEV
jgi:RNA polymerase sigma-70 factor (ECF subfamily)